MGRKPNRTYYLCHLPLLLALKLQSSSPGNECGNGSVRQIDKALYFDENIIRRKSVVSHFSSPALLLCRIELITSFEAMGSSNSFSRTPKASISRAISLNLPVVKPAFLLFRHTVS
jgi:hypothetical protein